MINLKSTSKMLKLRNTMGFTYDTNNTMGDTRKFFAHHNIDMVKHWSEDDATNIYSLIFPSEQDELLFKLKYSEYL